jgi:hypothetical protein
MFECFHRLTGRSPQPPPGDKSPARRIRGTTDPRIICIQALSEAHRRIASASKYAQKHVVSGSLSQITSVRTIRNTLLIARTNIRSDPLFLSPPRKLRALLYEADLVSCQAPFRLSLKRFLIHHSRSQSCLPSCTCFRPSLGITLQLPHPAPSPSSA